MQNTSYFKGQSLRFSNLDVSNQDLDDSELDQLSKIIADHKTLTSVNLLNSSVYDHGLEAISKAVGFSSSLTRLNLGSNFVTSVGTRALADSLCSPTSLIKTLWLGGNPIGYDGVKIISEVFGCGKNYTLTDLSLRECNLYDEGVIAIATALLKGTNSLLNLDLHGNHIGPVGAQAIAEVLRVTHHHSHGKMGLEDLDLSQNVIKDEGVKVIATFLQGNTTLKRLNLHYNLITDLGAQALSETLLSNTTLTTLQLGYNMIYKDGFDALVTALQTNLSIVKMHVTLFDEHRQMPRLLKRNKTLKKKKGRQVRSFLGGIGEPTNLLYEGSDVFFHIKQALQRSLIDMDYQNL